MISVILNCLILIVSSVYCSQAISWMWVNATFSFSLLTLNLHSLFLNQNLALITYCLLLIQIVVLRVLIWIMIWGNGSTLFWIWTTICTSNHHRFWLSFRAIYLAISAFVASKTSSSSMLTLFYILCHDIIDWILVVLKLARLLLLHYLLLINGTSWFLTIKFMTTSISPIIDIFIIKK